jgi:hypothetical protein
MPHAASHELGVARGAARRTIHDDLVPGKDVVERGELHQPRIGWIARGRDVLFRLVAVVTREVGPSADGFTRCRSQFLGVPLHEFREIHGAGREISGAGHDGVHELEGVLQHVPDEMRHRQPPLLRLFLQDALETLGDAGLYEAVFDVSAVTAQTAMTIQGHVLRDSTNAAGTPIRTSPPLQFARDRGGPALRFFRIAQVPTRRQGSELVVELVKKRRSRRDVELDDVRIADALQVFHERP